MVMAAICRIPWWPIGGGEFLGGLLAVAGVVFSIVMLIDCLKRPMARFKNPLTANGEYDKLIWAAAIVASLWFYFLGAIVYFFVVKGPKQKKKKE